MLRQVAHTWLISETRA